MQAAQCRGPLCFLLPSAAPSRTSATLLIPSAPVCKLLAPSSSPCYLFPLSSAPYCSRLTPSKYTCPLLALQKPAHLEPPSACPHTPASSHT